jgi:hypothetical protein
MTITWQRHAYCGPSESIDIDEAVKGLFCTVSDKSDKTS